MRKVSTFFSDFNQKDMVIPIKIVSFVIELNYSNTMYGKMKDFLSQTLAEIKEAGLYKEERLIESAQQAAITVKGKEVLNFCANNYLGLSNHPRLIKASQEMMNRRGYGMSSVRFICGTQDIHKELEAAISDYFQTEDTILYAACFDANGGVFEPLFSDQDAIISDSLNHASIIDGVRLCKAKRYRYANADMNELEKCLQEAQAQRFRIIVTDGVFSMDGNVAPMDQICDLAEKYDALVMVDESHSAGVVGATGHGVSELYKTHGRVDIYTGTLGKAFGGALGGFTTGRKEIIDLLRQRSRPYLFSNSLAPGIIGIHHFSMKLLCLSPAEFIHFGTTRELRSLVTKDVQDYEFLDWKMQVNSAVQKEGFAAHNAYVGSRAKIGKEAYLENCYILGNSEVGDGTVLSHVRIMDRKIPEQIVMHGIELTGGKKVIRIYGVPDNPKGKYPGEVSFLGTTLNQFMAQNKVTKEELWKGEETYLWFADLYPVCDDWEDALDMAEIIYKMAHGTATKEEISRWRESERMSLYSSFNAADIEASCDQERFLENRILARCFIRKLEQGMYYADALKIFGKRGISKEIFKLLMEDAAEADFSLKIRIYHAVSCYMKKTRTIYDDLHYDALENDCFGTIQEVIYEEAEKKLPDSAGYRIVKDQVDIALPVRVNWGGGWTDTPPHCNEKGGVVLNAAMKLRGIYPVQITVKRLDELHVEFESKDIGVYTTVDSAAEIQDCHNPYDSFALHKAALIACGIIPVREEADLQEILKRMGGGIYLSTQVYGVPKGSGLGTSSILSGACVKGIFEFLGQELEPRTPLAVLPCR